MYSEPPPLDQMLRDLIGIPSVSSVVPELNQGNEAVIYRLAQWLEGAGYRVRIQALPGYPARANLIATLGVGNNGLVLAGHTDTVPCDSEGWRHDPFSLTDEGGRLYGLGTSDMKSFLALAIEATRGLKAQELGRPLTILATADEESTMCGARELARVGMPLGRYAVIGEPTGLRPVRLHKGVLMEAIRLIGRSGHSSDPALGNSALEGMHELIGELLRWRAALQSHYQNFAFSVPVPTLNLGHIHGGDNPNRICGRCELHFDLRPTPGLDARALRDEIGLRVAEVAQKRGLHWEMESLFPDVPPMETGANSAIVRFAEQLTGHSAEAVSFATEAPFLNALGMETLVWGPGDIAQAHQPDEYLDTARINPTLTGLRAMIRRFCIDPNPAEGGARAVPLPA